MKVYIVTAGSYSDYSIRAVSDTKESAQEDIDIFAGDMLIFLLRIIV